MKIRLSDHFNCRRLLRFTLPSIIMMIFTSIYSIVDGFFVSNYVGKTQFAAVNFIMPFLIILGAFGFMFGTGGSALVAVTLGKGKKEEANRRFSLLIYVSLAVGIIVAVLGIIFLRPIAVMLGAEGNMLDDCVLYGRIILAALPAYMLQMEFQSFFVTAERPKLGLAVTVLSGGTNMVLDALLVGVWKYGLVGAAVATAVSQLIGGILPLLYFVRKTTSLLKLTRTKWDGRVILKAATNGSSELMSNISMSIVGMLYNTQLLHYAGENGIAAYGVLMYVGMIFNAAFIGYSVGTAPVTGYHYGAGNYDELKGIFKKSLGIIGCFSVCMLAASEILARPLAHLYVGYDEELLEITVHAFQIYSFSFLFAGFAIFGSGFFTALNDGPTSALISFLRTLVFQTGAVLLLPRLFDIDGIWYSIVVAEVMAVLVAGALLVLKRKKYHYA